MKSYEFLEYIPEPIREFTATHSFQPNKIHPRTKKTVQKPRAEWNENLYCPLGIMLWVVNYVGGAYQTPHSYIFFRAMDMMKWFPATLTDAKKSNVLSSIQLFIYDFEAQRLTGSQLVNVLKFS